MKSFPIAFVDSVNATTSHLRCQADTVESFLPRDAAEFPSLLQSVVVHVNYKHARRVSFERYDANGSDSGWCLSDLSDPLASSDASRFSLVSLYQLALDRPGVGQVFCFSGRAANCVRWTHGCHARWGGASGPASLVHGSTNGARCSRLRPRTQSECNFKEHGRAAVARAFRALSPPAY